jgi:hypothetical protein
LIAGVVVEKLFLGLRFASDKITDSREAQKGKRDAKSPFSTASGVISRKSVSTLLFILVGSFRPRLSTAPSLAAVRIASPTAHQIQKEWAEWEVGTCS